MKKILLVILLVLPLLLGQTIITGKSTVVAWDAVSSFGGDIIEYEVFIAPLGNYNAAQSLGETNLLETEVTVSTEGNWVIGVRTVRTIIVSSEVLYSNINWSDINGLATPAPFFLKYYKIPVAPSNLRLQ